MLSRHICTFKCLTYPHPMALRNPLRLVLSIILFVDQTHRNIHCQSSPLSGQAIQATFKGRVERTNAPPKAEELSRSVASWESWHSAMPACSSSDALSGGAIYATEHGDFVYEPASCYLRSFTAEEARRYNFWYPFLASWLFAREMSDVYEDD